MAFVKYSRGFRGIDTEPTVSISKNGTVNLNARCAMEYIKEECFVTMYFDKEEKRIGIELNKKQEKDTYALKQTKNSKSRNIYAGGLFKFYGLLDKETRRFKPEYDKEKNMIIIDLKKPLKAK